MLNPVIPILVHLHRHSSPFHALPLTLCAHSRADTGTFDGNMLSGYSSMLLCSLVGAFFTEISTTRMPLVLSPNSELSSSTPPFQLPTQLSVTPCCWCVETYPRLQTYTHLHTPTQAYTHGHTHAHPHTHTATPYIHRHTHTHAHMHTHTHSLTRTQTSALTHTAKPRKQHKSSLTYSQHWDHVHTHLLRARCNIACVSSLISLT